VSGAWIYTPCFSDRGSRWGSKPVEIVYVDEQVVPRGRGESASGLRFMEIKSKALSDWVLHAPDCILEPWCLEKDRVAGVHGKPSNNKYVSQEKVFRKRQHFEQLEE